MTPQQRRQAVKMDRIREAHDLALADIMGDLLADGMDPDRARALAEEHLASAQVAEATSRIPLALLPEGLPAIDPVFARRRGAVDPLADLLVEGKVLACAFQWPACAPDRVAVWLDDTQAGPCWFVRFDSTGDQHTPHFRSWPSMLAHLGALATGRAWTVLRSL